MHRHEDPQEEQPDNTQRNIEEFGIQLNPNAATALRLAAKRLLNDDYIDRWSTVGDNALPDPRLVDIQTLVTAGETWAWAYAAWGLIDRNDPQVHAALLASYQYFSDPQFGAQRVALQQTASERFYNPEQVQYNLTHSSRDIPIKQILLVADVVVGGCSVYQPEQAQSSWMQRSQKLNVAATLQQLDTKLREHNILVVNQQQNN